MIYEDRTFFMAGYFLFFLFNSANFGMSPSFGRSHGYRASNLMLIRPSKMPKHKGPKLIEISQQLNLGLQVVYPFEGHCGTNGHWSHRKVTSYPP